MRSRIWPLISRFFRSRFLVIAAVLWIFTSLVIIVAVQVDHSFTYLDGGSVPDFQNSMTINLNGSNVAVYSQTINQFGQGMPGDPVYFNLTVSSGASRGSVIDHGYGGLTDSTGYLSYNASGVTPDNTYSLDESVHGPGLQGHINSSIQIFTLTNQNGVPAFFYSGDTVLITPVINKSDHSLFTLHVWTPPPYSNREISVYYQKSPVLSLGPYDSSLFAFNYKDSLASTTLNYEKNIPTRFDVHGNPYYYGVVIRNANGSKVGSFLFSTLETPSVEAAYTVEGAFGILAVGVVSSSIFTTHALINGLTTERNRRTERLLNRMERLKSSRRSEIFIDGVAVSTVFSLPFIAVTSILTFYFSGAVSGQFLSPAKAAGFTAAAILTGVISSGIGALAFSNRTGMFSGPIEKTWTWKKLGRASIRWAGLLVLIYYIVVNMMGSFFYPFFNVPSAMIRNVLISNLVNPVAYSWLTGEYISRNLMVANVFSFQPSSFGLTIFLLGGLGAVWTTVFVFMPYLILRKRESSQ